MEITLITGASSGLGKAFAEIYAREDKNLLLVASNKDRLSTAVREIEEINGKVVIDSYICDLSKYDEIKNFIYYVESKGYLVSNLINCAGFGDQNEFVDMDIDFQVKMTEVNCNAPMILMRAFIPKMIENGGNIINVASIAGLYPGPYMSTYHCTKAFLVSLSEAVRYELRNTKVKVLTLCPGPFTSNFVAKAHNDWTFKVKKVLSAEEVAKRAKKALDKNKGKYIVGADNRIQYFASRFVGKGFILSSSAKTIVQGGKGKN